MGIVRCIQTASIGARGECIVRLPLIFAQIITRET